MSNYRKLFYGKQSASAFLLFKYELIFFSLIHCHTMPHFDTLKIYSCGKNCRKRRKYWIPEFSPFHTVFLKTSFLGSPHSLPRDKISDWSKSKAFVDDEKKKVTEKLKFVL